MAPVYCGVRLKMFREEEIPFLFCFLRLMHLKDVKASPTGLNEWNIDGVKCAGVLFTGAFRLLPCNVLFVASPHRQVRKHHTSADITRPLSLPSLDAPRKKPNFSCCTWGGDGDGLLIQHYATELWPRRTFSFHTCKDECLLWLSGESEQKVTLYVEMSGFVFFLY